MVKLFEASPKKSAPSIFNFSQPVHRFHCSIDVSSAEQSALETFASNLWQLADLSANEFYTSTASLPSCQRSIVRHQREEVNVSHALCCVGEMVLRMYELCQKS